MIKIQLEPEEAPAVFLASPEDMVLQKLIWYRLGGGVSDRQWADIQGILKVQSNYLDRAYIQQWAEHLGLSELLVQALGPEILNSFC